MTTTAKLGIVFLTTAVTLALTYFLLSISYSNTELRLRNQLTAKESARVAIFDETWKSVKQIAQVTDKYADDFKEIYPELMSGRYGNARGGALMSWVQESNPELSTDLYMKLANVIEIKRAEFTNIQRQVIDVKREHDNILDTFPGSHFLAGRQKIEIQVISSEKTKGVISSGEENNIDVF